MARKYLHIVLTGLSSDFAGALQESRSKWLKTNDGISFLPSTSGQTNCHSLGRHLYGLLSDAGPGVTDSHEIIVFCLQPAAIARLQQASRFSVFPVAYPENIPWDRYYGRPQKLRTLLNRAIDSLRTPLKLVRQNLGLLRSELNSKANSTPLLLPQGNFRSSRLSTYLQSVADALSTADLEETLKKQRARLNEAHFKRVASGGNRRQYVDDSRTTFQTPSSHRERHGESGGRSTEAGHSLWCRCASRRRFGVLIPEGFHYDCQLNSAERRFVGCHREELGIKTGTHLNISPDDFIRGLSNS